MSTAYARLCSWCKAAPVKKRRGQFCSNTCSATSREATRVRDVEAEFWERAIPEPNTGCWLWMGDMSSFGYGVARFGSEGRRRVAAHRRAYQFAVGPTPEGLDVCHRCDNRACVNPGHLFLGTRAENLADMVAKGRSARGEKHHAAKLTAKQVQEIRRDMAGSGIPFVLAARFGVSVATIHDIAERRSWPHV